MRLILHLVVAFSLMIPMQNESSAQEVLTLEGVVVGSDSQPKTGVHVYFQGPASYFALTNDKGTFQIKQFKPGQYSVRVQQGDFAISLLRDIHSSQLKLIVDW